MKKTKRIIAIIFCIIICMTSVVLITAAEETDKNTIILKSRDEICDCGHYIYDRSLQVYTGRYDIIATKYWCRRLYYDNVIMKCVDCGNIYIITFGEPVQHPTLVYNTQTGKYYCNVCGYIQE